jgi:hypothetical protein
VDFPAQETGGLKSGDERAHEKLPRRIPKETKMKKHIPTTALILLATLGALGQGYINYSTRVVGVVVGHVYAGSDFIGRTGNTPSETPAGTQTYSGHLLVTGSGFSAQLFAAAGAGQAEGSLVAVPGSIASFRSGSTAGTISPSVLSVPNVLIHGTGTFQLRVWDNMGGTITSWDFASYRGRSDPFTVSNLGDGVLDFPADLAGFRSFSIYDPSYVPEPGTYALFGLGALGLWLFRRKQSSR